LAKDLFWFYIPYLELFIPDFQISSIAHIAAHIRRHAMIFSLWTAHKFLFVNML